MPRVIAASLSLLFLTAACGKATERVAEEAIERSASQDGQEVEVDFSGDGSLTVQSEQGNFAIGAAAKIPDSFPADIPIYQGFSPLMVSESNEGKEVTLQGFVPDEPKNVYDFYKKEVSGKGWTEKNAVQMNDNMFSLEYAKEARKLSVVITEGDMNEKKGTMLVVTAVDES